MYDFTIILPENQQEIAEKQLSSTNQLLLPYNAAAEPEAPANESPDAPVCNAPATGCAAPPLECDAPDTAPPPTDAAPKTTIHSLDREIEIERLASLSSVEYDQERKQIATAWGIRVSSLDDIVLARRREEQQAAQTKAEELSKMQPRPNVDVPNFYPPGFFQVLDGDNAGLWYAETSKEGKQVEIYIGPNLFVLGFTRDETSKAWGLLLAWHDPDGGSHSWDMPKAMLEGDAAEYRRKLADGGWSCAPNPRARAKLAEFLAGVRPESRVLCVSRTGWHGEAYVLPDETIQKKSMLVDVEQILLQRPTAKNPFVQKGSLDEWREGVATLALGNSRIILALCAALAAPLLYPCSAESGGFNFVGYSTTGKTTALLAASSIWGDGNSKDGYMETWRSTDNGLESRAALHCDALLALDEIGQAPARVVAEAAYMLANGTGKSRARADGTARTAQTWRLLVLSTGEAGLTDRIRETGVEAKAGQQVRLLDIPADAGAGMGMFEDVHGYPNSSAFASALQSAAKSAYGTAGRAFIQKVAEMGNGAVAKMWSEYRAAELETLAGPEADGQIKRAAERFLLCILAGTWATRWGILPWPDDAAAQAVSTCFHAWLEKRGGSGPAEDLALISQVTKYLEQYGQSRFPFVGDNYPCPNRAGFRVVWNDTIQFHCFVETFRDEIVKGYPPKRAARVLKEAGMLIPTDEERMQHWITGADGKRAGRGYVLTIPIPEGPLE